MKIVLDTNTVVSGFLWPGTAPRTLLDAGIEGRIGLATSIALLDELEDVLSRAKFAKAIVRSRVSAAALLDRYARAAEIVVPAEINRTVVGDRDDDAVLACAIAAGVQIIVSRDKRLRNLKHFLRIPILSALQAVERIPEAALR